MTDWSLAEPEHFKRADELLMMEQSRDRVVLQIIAAGMSEEDATALVAQAWEQGREDRRLEGYQEVKVGLISIGAGVLINLVLGEALSGLGVPIRLIFWSPVLYGAGSAFWGWRKLAS